MSALWTKLLLPFIALLVLCVSAVGLVLGACLVARSAATLRAMASMNRWISSRRALKPFEIPRGGDSGPRKQRPWMGAILLVAGLYVLFVLVFRIDTQKASSLIAQAGIGPVLSLVVVESLRWMLVAGSALVVVVGAVMAFAPRAYERAEAWANSWISSRRLVAGGDQMHTPLDGIAERHPRAMGTLLILLSLVGAGAGAVLLAQLR